MVTTPDPCFAEDVRAGLTADAKAIPPKWLYDERGSKLFEEITELDEYYLTRTERAILEANADEIIAACPSPLELVELGAGSADKTRLLIEAAIQAQGPTVYCPVDISKAAIEMAKDRLEDRYQELTVRPVIGAYTEGLGKLADPGAPPRLVLFIGSSIGNFELTGQRELLSSWGKVMRPQDRFLLGTDMRKPASILEPAYNDAKGVTARFTENLLVRMNRELGANFDLGAFEHTARFNPDESRIEIHLASQRDQEVHLEALDLTVAFQEGELLHTENSYKYTEELIEDLVTSAGLERVRSWYDDQAWFGVHLLAPSGRSPV